MSAEPVLRIDLLDGRSWGIPRRMEGMLRPCGDDAERLVLLREIYGALGWGDPEDGNPPPGKNPLLPGYIGP